MRLGKSNRYKLALLSQAEVPYVYHVTFLGRIPNIQSEGLQPTYSPNFPGHSAHSQDRVFFTEQSGINFWHSRLEQVGTGETDWLDEDSADWIPVVLRMPANKLRDAYRDEIGTEDAFHEAYYMTQPAHPALIEAWNGTNWINLEDVDPEGMRQHIISSSEYNEPEENEGEEGWWDMNPDALLPKEV
jgi:hypothetical protein